MFETDEIERQLVQHPGVARMNLRRKAIVDTVMATVSGGVMAIQYIGFFIGFIATLVITVDAWVFWRVWCEFKNIKKGKRMGLYFLWLAACLGVGVGLSKLLWFVLIGG